MIEEAYSLPDGSQVTLADLRRYAYTTGYFLEERYDPLQLELDIMYSQMKPRTRAFILFSRKIGKTYGLLAYADKQARRYRDQIIRFAYPTETQGKTIILPILNELQRDCPADLRWVNREAQEKCWWLPHTNSRIYLAGTDTADQVDRLRGPMAHLIVLDELPTFKGDLTYLINSVLWPQTLNTGGLLLMSGTPPRTMDHPSIGIIKNAERTGRLVKKTIFDNPRLTPDIIRTICEEANPALKGDEVLEVLSGRLEGSPDWEREFLCRMVTDKNMRVTPEFKEIEHVRKCDKLLHSYKFVFMDPGHVKDFFGGTFCEIDFAAQRLIVRRDYKSRRKATDEVLADFRQIETDLGWTPEDPPLRYIDSTSQQTCTDFCKKGYFTSLALKSPGKGQVVTELRNRLNADQVFIDPCCKDLINQLNDGIWKDTAKDDFERTPDMGHLDVLDSLAQGTMTIQATNKWAYNPAPKGVYLDRAASYLPPSMLKPVDSPVRAKMREVFQVRRHHGFRSRSR